MALDVKKEIAEAARTLLMDKNVKKLTVKDIVEECHITRQTFYYHFEDIPDLLHWILEKKGKEFIKEARNKDDVETGLRYFFLMAINVKQYVRKMMQSNYGEEMERLLKRHIYQMFEQIVEEDHLYEDCSRFELKLILRYHCGAVWGILEEWTEEDTKNLDKIVHEIYLLIMGERLPVFSEK